LIALGSDPCAEPDCEVLLTDAANAARVALSEHEMTSVGNVSLCHGALGNLEILERAANVRGLVGIVNAKECREWIHREHVAWRCGDEYRSPVQSTRAAPSLMNGLAGIGYGLLRHLAPSVVPSVLFLEISPRQSRLAPTAGPHGN
jgi:lantibiotic modifying enzyme